MKTRSLSQPCKELEENYYLCHEINLPYHIEDPCISSIMRFETNITTCNPVSVEINSLIIHPIHKNRWIVYSKKTVVLKETCKGEIVKNYLLGTYVIVVDGSCEVTINSIKLKSHTTNGKQFQYEKSPKIKLPELPQIKSATKMKPVNLDDVNLENLQLLTYALRKTEENSGNYEESINTKSISIGTIILYPVIVIIILICIIRKYKKHKCNKRGRNSQKNENSENFELKEGGVMMAHPLSRVVNVST
ncbi:unnamed protein product [Diatraea saccharalis]|uniref:Uncharacterized protein n=1 Tax=Diatraea saccharalis TaxID=40085 RepID=A0A9N9R4U4_9NEOP|nr:unnamed protein product [Diatraea saccharalis]